MTEKLPNLTACTEGDRRSIERILTQLSIADVSLQELSRAIGNGVELEKFLTATGVRNKANGALDSGE